MKFKDFVNQQFSLCIQLYSFVCFTSFVNSKLLTCKMITHEYLYYDNMVLQFRLGTERYKSEQSELLIMLQQLIRFCFYVCVYNILVYYTFQG